MLKFLNKPYPFNDDLKHNGKIILFISLGVLIFLLLFQPIEISRFSYGDIFYLVTGLAASTFLVLSFNLIVLPSLFPKIFYHKVWNIKREIFWNIWILFTISSSDLLFYTKIFGLIDIHLADIGRIILLGFLPVSVLIIINQDRLLRSYLKSARQLNSNLTEHRAHKEKLIHFESDYQKDDLIIKAGALILIKSANNYIEVYFESEDKLHRKLIRTTLKKVEEAIQHFDFIIRCHRTFIINVNHITEITGNSQGYKLYFKQVDFPALVSQKYMKDLNKII